MLPRWGSLPGLCRRQRESHLSGRDPGWSCGYRSPVSWRPTAKRDCMKRKTAKEQPAWTPIALTLLTCLTCSHVIGLPLRSIAPSATMMMFKREPRPLCWKRQVRLNTRGFFRLKPANQHRPTVRLLHLGVSCTDAPPTPRLEASLEWTPSRLHRPEPSPKRGICCWKVVESLTQNTNFLLSF